MGKKKELSITIVNNENARIPITVLNNPYNTSSIINQRTSYSYDLSAFVFTTENKVDLQYRNVGATSYLNKTASLPEQTIQSVLNVLNSFGVATFFLDAAGTSIITYNDKIELGDIVIYDNASSVTLQWFNNTTVIGSGNLSLDDTINPPFVSSPNGLGQSGTASFPVGTQIRIVASADATEGPSGLDVESTPPLVLINQQTGFDTVYSYVLTLADPSLTYIVTFY